MRSGRCLKVLDTLRAASSAKARGHSRVAIAPTDAADYRGAQHRADVMHLEAAQLCRSNHDTKVVNADAKVAGE